jgi:bilin biosynthesis protein
MLCRTRSGRPLWQACLSAGFCLGLISAAAAQDHPVSSAQGPSAPGVEALVTDDLLTLHAAGAPLGEVLRAIGTAGAVEVVLRGTFATPVRESFAGRPLEDAILHLVEGHSVVLLRDDPDPASGAGALAEIRVIENPDLAASDDATPDAPSAAGAEVARDDAADESALEDDTDEPPMDREAFRLANLGVPPPTREDILLELGDPDQAARVAAVPLVGSLARGAAVDILSDVFAEEDDTTVRSRAVAVLTRLDGPAARRLLRERALGDDDPGLRMQALNALASSSGERAVNVLGQALRDDPEPKVRIGAVRALGRVGGDRARRSLEHAARDLDLATSLAAEQALAAWPEPHN